MIKDETSDRGTVHVSSVNNVYNDGMKSLSCLYVNARTLVNNFENR